MKSIHTYFLFLLVGISGAFCQERNLADNFGFQSFRVSPSCFIPNLPHQHTGKRLVDDNNVVAFVQTKDGRALFTESGVFIGISTPNSKWHQTCSQGHTMGKNRAFMEREEKTRTSVLKTGFPIERARKRKISPRFEEPSSGIVNFLVGPEEQWQTRVPTYGKLVYDQVWDGVDMEFLGFMDHLEFRLQIKPGYDPGQISIETGGKTLRILDDGRMQISMDEAKLVFGKPSAFQVLDGHTKAVPVQYKCLPGNMVGFELGSYNSEYPLTIDPTLSWSSYLGGWGGDGPEASKSISVDESGNIYITGYTPAGDFPSTAGSFDVTWNGGNTDVFVSKLDVNGEEILFSSFLGGSGSDYGFGIAVDNSGDPYVTGYTKSDDFPTTSEAFDETFNEGFEDAFVSKLSMDGSSLVYSSFIGGTDLDAGSGIAVDHLGNAYVTGQTRSVDFPTTQGAFDVTNNGSFSDDVFVCKLSSDGKNLIYSTFFGGSDWDDSYGIVLDLLGNAYIAGSTNSMNFPTTTGAYSETLFGATDGFVAKLNSSGSSLVFSSLIGGTDADVIFAIAMDSSDNIFVTGYTSSFDFPTTMFAVDDSFNGNKDVFISKLRNDGRHMIYSTYLGNSEEDIGYGITVDQFGNTYVTGITYSSGFPTTQGAYDGTYKNYSDGFIAKLNSSGNSLIYSTFLGGMDYDDCNGIVVDSSGNAIVTGGTNSIDFPTTAGVVCENFNGPSDGFVTKLSSDGHGLIFSSFVGGTSYEKGNGIAVDSGNNVLVIGSTWSSNYPTTPGVYDETWNNGSVDIFVSKLNFDGASLIYSTFIGGTNNDLGEGITLDREGNAYITGNTSSIDFPITEGAFDSTYNGGISDVFVCKLNTSGNALVYSSFLGGEAEDRGYAIAVDNLGAAYVTGGTPSFLFPTTPGAFAEFRDNGLDGFVTKMSSNGSSLVYSTFLGGAWSDLCLGIAVGSSGEACVTGYTSSDNFPITNGGYDQTSNGNYDGFVSRLNSDGSDLSYSTYLGGTNSDYGYGIGFDDLGNVYVAGYTFSNDFPTTIEAYNETSNGYHDIFVTKIDMNDNTLSYSTYLGGSGTDYCRGIAVDGVGNTYVTGQTFSNDFPIVNVGWGSGTNSGNGDLFASKLSPNGDYLQFSTYLGGSDRDDGIDIAIDNSANIYVTGLTFSHDFPTTSGALTEMQHGYGDAFVSKFLFYLDYNNDGCSNVNDFNDLLPYWNQIFNQIPLISVLDFLWINMDGPVPCP